MLYRLQRHPFAVKATFRHSIVLTYVLPAARLQPLMRPGLRLDEWNGLAFLAIALVATERLRPVFLPACCGARATDTYANQLHAAMVRAAAPSACVVVRSFAEPSTTLAARDQARSEGESPHGH